MRKPPPDPWSYVWKGVIGTVVAALLLAFGGTSEDAQWASLVGAVLGVVAGVWFLVGVIAAGITVAHDYQQHLDLIVAEALEGEGDD